MQHLPAYNPWLIVKIMLHGICSCHYSVDHRKIDMVIGLIITFLKFVQGYNNKVKLKTDLEILNLINPEHPNYMHIKKRTDELLTKIYTPKGDREQGRKKVVIGLILTLSVIITFYILSVNVDVSLLWDMIVVVSIGSFFLALNIFIDGFNILYENKED